MKTSVWPRIIADLVFMPIWTLGAGMVNAGIQLAMGTDYYSTFSTFFLFPGILCFGMIAFDNIIRIAMEKSAMKKEKEAEETRK